MRRRIFMIVIGSVLLIAGLAFIFRSNLVAWLLSPTPSDVPVGIGRSDEVEVLAERLRVPWRTAVLPDGEILLSERGGTLRSIQAGKEIATIQGVVATGEGGLLGLAVHPDFQTNRFIYLYLTSQGDGGLINRVERYVYRDGKVSNRQVLIDGIPGSPIHDGGELQFGPDKKLFVGTGDAGEENLAQDPSSLAGKILRLNDDGSVPEDNPFGTAVWSLGHRNVQGLAFDDKGRLWATEHGPSGMQSGFDEINLIERGANYGWPIIRGDGTAEGMRTPVIHSGAADTWAPSGMAFADGSLYFAGLRSRTLYQARILDTDRLDLTAHFSGEFGRLRSVTAHDGTLLVTTSNTDGRGRPSNQDDRLLSIPLGILE